jgi:hypothetical protein
MRALLIALIIALIGIGPTSPEATAANSQLQEATGGELVAQRRKKKRKKRRKRRKKTQKEAQIKEETQIKKEADVEKETSSCEKGGCESQGRSCGSRS